MRVFVLIITLIVSLIPSLFAQDLTGRWSGILMTGGVDPSKGEVIYLQFDSSTSGMSRVELLENTKEFAVKDFVAKQNGNKLSITEGMVRRSSKTPKSPECKYEFDLVYNTETAYLTGTFISSDCRAGQGNVVFFRADHVVNTEKEPTSTHNWTTAFIRNYKKGYPAPEIMEKERQGFKFQAIFFDHDDDVVKEEYHSYLREMARVLDGVHDLRVKIIGHTDAIGPDGYNTGLSERRAASIRKHFEKLGIDPQKLEIDFRGMHEPIDSNSTREGRQRNRRVVFEFI